MESRYFHATSPVMPSNSNRPSMCALLEVWLSLRSASHVPQAPCHASSRAEAQTPAGAASRNGDDLVQDAGDARHLLDDRLGELPLLLGIDGSAQTHVAAAGGDEDAAGVEGRVRQEGGLRSRRDAQVDELALRGLGGLEPPLAQRLLNEARSLIGHQALGVEHDIIEQRIVDVHLIQELHARGALVSALTNIAEG